MTAVLLLRACTLPLEILDALRPRRSLAAANDAVGIERSLTRRAAALTEALHREAGPAGAASSPSAARRRVALLALRRDVHNGRPLGRDLQEQVRESLPSGLAGALEAHEAEVKARDQAIRSFRDSFRADLEAARTALAGHSKMPIVEEAIALASRSLLDRVRALPARAASSWGHDERHTASKLLSYVARFCTKTSPNGLFCATALASAAGDAAVVAGSPGIDRLDPLLSVQEATKIAACLAAAPEVEPAVRPRPNPTLRLREGAWTYWKPASNRNAKDDEVLCRVKDSPALRVFLDLASTGALPPAALVTAAARRCEADVAAIETFYRGLVTRGILLAEIEIPYVERRPLRMVARVARDAGAVAPWIEKVEEIESSVDALAALSAPARIDAMRTISEDLSRLPHARELSLDELFRIDAASALSVRLPTHVLEDLRLPLERYARLFSTLFPLQLYRETLAVPFLARHPADADIPLLDLYDGLLEPAPFKRPAAFPGPGEISEGVGRIAREAAEAMKRVRDLLASRALACDTGEEIQVDEELLREARCPEQEPRWSSGVLFQIAAAGPGAIDRREHRIVISSLFNGAGVAISRFAHLLGGEAHPAAGGAGANPIVNLLEKSWACVGAEGAVVAEVTYNHHGRTANAGLRPSIFPYEIETPGEKASPDATVIPLTDLAVRWDTPRRRFVMRWLSKGLEVLPVINSGVNPVGLFALLVKIGQADLQPLGWFPGFDHEEVTHWPRISCGRVILFRERWVFGPGGWPASTEGGRPLDDAGWFLETARWRARHSLPRRVFVHTTEDAKPRYLDLESPLFVDLLRRALAEVKDPAGRLHVTEMLPGPGEMWVADEHGRYATEFLVQMQGPGGLAIA